jgi:hypothetical protein
MPSGIDHREKPTTVSLFEGSPAYKQRKKKGVRDSALKRCESRERGLQTYDAAGTDAEDDCELSDEENSMNGSSPAKKEQALQRISQLCTMSKPPDATGRHEVHVAQSRTPGTSEYPSPRLEAVYLERLNPDDSSMGFFVGGGNSATVGLHGNSNPGIIAAAVPEQKAAIEQIQASWHMPYLPVPMAPNYRSTADIHQLPSTMIPVLGAKRNISQSTQDSEFGQDTAGSSSDNGGVSASGRMFQCPLDTCGRLFKRLEHLKRHVRTHTQERPYACTQCGKRFSRSDNLTQHIKIHDKVNRNERGKTEYTEDEDLVKVLEARVEAMRGHPPSDVYQALPSYHGSGYVTDTPLYLNSSSHMERGCYQAHLRSSLPPPFAPARTAYYQRMPHAPTYHTILGNAMDGNNSVQPYLVAPNNQSRPANPTLDSRSHARSPTVPPTSYRMNPAPARSAILADVLGAAQRLGRPKAAAAFDNRYSPYLANRTAITDEVSIQGQFSNHSAMEFDIQPATVLRFMNQNDIIPVQKQYICDPVGTSVSKSTAVTGDGMRSHHDAMQTPSLHSITQTIHQPSRSALAPNADRIEAPVTNARISVTPVAHQQDLQPSEFSNHKGTTSPFAVTATGNPPVSSDTLSFRGMLVTASYEPGSAVWPANAVSPGEHGYFETQPSPAGNLHHPHDMPTED